jgi:hypothetical protein
VTRSAVPSIVVLAARVELMADDGRPPPTLPLRSRIVAPAPPLLEEKEDVEEREVAARPNELDVGPNVSEY